MRSIRESIGATVCYDFRSGDCAAGGHGAPLVPYVDALLLRDENEDRIALNLGGIANVTLLPGDGSIVAFDTGPANLLLDAFVAQRTGEAFDDGGRFARRGRVDRAALAAMLEDPYFDAPPPKTTGRERFGLQFLARHAGVLDNLSTEDGAATLCELTAAAIADAVARERFVPARVIVSGGGARQPYVARPVGARFDGAAVEQSDLYDYPPMQRKRWLSLVLGSNAARPGRKCAGGDTRHGAVFGAMRRRKVPRMGRN